MEEQPISPLTPAGVAILEAHAARRKRPVVAPERPTGSPFWPLLWLLPLFLAGDCAFGLLTAFDGAQAHEELGSALAMITAAGCVGLIAVQAMLLAIYVVFSPDAYWRRLALFLAVLVPLAGAGLAGHGLLFLWQDWPIDEAAIRYAIRFPCALPAIAVIMQCPFWILRLAFGWQFVRGEAAPESGPLEIESQSLTGSDWLLAIAVTAAAFSCLVLAPASDSPYDPPLAVMAATFGVLGAIAALIFGIPLILMFTHFKKMRWAWSLALGIPLIIGALGFAVAALTMPWHEFTEFALFGAAMAASLFLTFIGGIAAGIRLWRWHGWAIRPAHAAE